MRIPKEDAKRLEFYKEISFTCMQSRPRRVEQYSQWRNYYFNGSMGDIPSAWNKIYSHLDTVTSFLYASDSTRFSVRMGTHAPKADYHRVRPFANRIMEEWKNSNADVIYQMGILFALIYDTTIIKHIRKRGSIYPYMIDPACFGVYREDVPMLDRQEAFTHVYYITLSSLEKKLALHPNKNEILQNVNDSFTKKDTSNETPPFVDRVILTSGQPGAGMNTVIGEANINVSTQPLNTAENNVPVIEMQEIWVWNDAIDDYQVCTMASEQVIVYDRQNLCFPRTDIFEGEHGFVQICPNPLYDYFWGQSEVSKLAALQEKRNIRMDDIQRLLAKQVDPPNAWGGQGLPEDKMAAFNSPGSMIAISDPMFKRETFVPQIPNNLYQDIEMIDAEFDDISGLPNVVQGKGESGVRSAGHAGKLLTVGSSRAKKRAQIIEDSLEKGASLYGKFLYVGETEELYDDHNNPFIIAQMDPDFIVEVDAHSNSPIFTESLKQDAAALFKAKAIDRENLIRMMHPPMEEELIRDLKDRIIPAEKKAAEEKMKAEQAAAEAKAAGKPNLKAVG